MRNISPILLLIAVLTSHNTLFAQKKEHLSGFSTLSVSYRFNPKWYVYGETQARSIADFSKIDYYEIKAGGGYNFNKKHQLFAGLGSYNTYTDSKKTREEFRVWLQYAYSEFISRVRIEQRFRTEKRFFHDPITDSNTNAERYRYRLSLIVPLNNETIQAKTLFVNTYDEVFFSSDAPTFSRNRLFGGIGYQASNSMGVTVGYLWQRDLSATKNTNTHFLFCGINFTLAHKEHKSSSTIVTPEAD
ncbi:DUF2490 domain-containing protein [Flavobacterium luminosum]|uniref:DUF2490 domain-containing protein n=1 Tax=Flavobacterium luminosum TaxID=2949086 RepID=A0ABT0TQD7_9FLAO|nr:DUF2490 domain-containing protein [Flavobacterium sp. HXWNR70]MCL9809704.1 DUF2490 domain-containing protein [Flavobacterium sp. HXWNR70]